MPFRCCVPNCRGNYDAGPKVHVFKFPADANLKKKWISAIHREKFTPSQTSRVCHLHFHDSEVLWQNEIYDDQTGQKLVAPLKIPRLKNGAVPSVFPNCPSYLSKEDCTREGPTEKRSRLEYSQLNSALAASLTSQKEYNKKYCYRNLEELLLRVKHVNIAKQWTVVHVNSECVCFVTVSCNPAPCISLSLVVDVNLNVQLYKGNAEIKTMHSRRFPMVINNIHQLMTLLSELLKFDSAPIQQSLPDHVLAVKNALTILEENVEDSDKDVVRFVSEQIGLINTAKFHHRFSSILMVFCCLLFSISAHAYRFLRGSGLVKLPHPSTLHRICTKFDINPCHEHEGGRKFLSYARQKFSYLTRYDTDVILMMDEIHLHQYLDYKGGNILGVSYNSEEAANSAYVFMLQSVKSKFKDVVHIVPVKKITAISLHNILLSLISGLENIGYRVFGIASDNNAINRKTLQLFSDEKELKIVYKHPVNPNRPLFFIIDPVHIIKSVRNNWINQKNKDMDMVYPAFPESGEAVNNVASFATLKKIYDIDSTSLVKYAHPLTLKALCPTRLERQSMKLVLQIFNRPVAEGLEVASTKFNLTHAHSTAEFIRIMVKWFDVMNVKSVYKGKRKLNPFMEPLMCNDFRIDFLYKFLDWLDVWKSRKLSSGFFTSETFLALKHTTYAVIEVARYCIEELGMQYLLTGKLQTDALEERFGKYRRLAGSHYNISVTQLYETEKKLRVQSVAPLMLNSASQGQIQIGPIDNIDDSETHSDSMREEIIVSDKDLDRLQDILPSLTYVAGYCARAVLRKINCDICKCDLVMERELPVNEHFILIDRLDCGGLKYPTESVINIVAYTYVVVHKLLTEFEKIFLFCENQRYVACTKSLAALDENECYLFDKVCADGHSSKTVTKMITWAAVNIFLKNYCKKENGQRVTKDSQRKLKTLTS